jgi:hypothetical protein
MITLNDLTRPWDAFMQTICERKEKLQFGSLCEECVQEEVRVANRESILLRDEDQALASLTEEKKCLISKKRPTFINNLTLQRDSPTFIKNLTFQKDSINIIRIKENSTPKHSHFYKKFVFYI